MRRKLSVKRNPVPKQPSRSANGSHYQRNKFSVDVFVSSYLPRHGFRKRSQTHLPQQIANRNSRPTAQAKDGRCHKLDKNPAPATLPATGLSSGAWDAPVTPMHQRGCERSKALGTRVGTPSQRDIPCNVVSLPWEHGDPLTAMTPFSRVALRDTGPRRPQPTTPPEDKRNREILGKLGLRKARNRKARNRKKRLGTPAGGPGPRLADCKPRITTQQPLCLQRHLFGRMGSPVDSHAPETLLLRDRVPWPPSRLTISTGYPLQCYPTGSMKAPS
ncbi:hypothetical protein PCANC_17875 [Puccinia coronata f. sp. avenae]|uniref:Uncharacterized protein n=1 Tax=Puccinia coronata f. sp. avenae TaxID=200324 RepID=A0A2N5SKI7_9BASI|nr:hypothetical protein PCANC_17875 [Puccinia coronata f. sp. avenae]